MRHNPGVLHAASEFLHDWLGCRDQRIQRSYLAVVLDDRWPKRIPASGVRDN